MLPKILTGVQYGLRVCSTNPLCWKRRGEPILSTSTWFIHTKCFKKVYRIFQIQSKILEMSFFFKRKTHLYFTIWIAVYTYLKSFETLGAWMGGSVCWGGAGHTWSSAVLLFTNRTGESQQHRGGIWFWLCSPGILSSSCLWTTTVVCEDFGSRERERHLCLPESCLSASSFIIWNPSPPLARKLGRTTLYVLSIWRGS